jgi:O6-methylguanine-DNA--protein-cysteine methyltransferase
MKKIFKINLLFIVVISLLLTTGCKKKEVPVLTTTDASNITATTASSGGNITSDGNETVTARGVCWGTAINPVISGSHTTDGTGAGSFISSITGLTGGNTYHVRAYATNSEGTAYGSDKTFATLGQAPISATVAASDILTISATLNGTVNANYLSTIVTFEYGLTTSYGSTATAAQSPVTGSTNTSVSAALTGLSAGTTYHFRLKTVNSLGTVYGADMSFTTLGQTPGSTTVAATSILTTSATVNGTVNANYLSSVVTFEYGLTTSYGSTATATPSPVTGNTSTSVSANLSGLSAGTTYHFRVKAVNSLGTTYGTDLTFVTLGQAPTATTLDASNLLTTSATLNGTVNANYLSSVVTFEYGLTTSYGITATATQSPVTGNTSTAVSANLSGLIPGAIYHFRVKAVNSIGTTNGIDLMFTTAGQAPSATTLAATIVLGITATLNGTVNANDVSTIVTFEYGLTTSYGSQATALQSPVTGNTLTNVSVDLTGLSPASLFHFRVKAVNAVGTTYGSDLTFTTIGQAPVARTKAATNVLSASATINGTVNANNLSTIVTFEYGLTTGYGTTITALQSPVSGGINSNVSADISGLLPSTTYNFRVIGENALGLSIGSNIAFTTAAK